MNLGDAAVRRHQHAAFRFRCRDRPKAGVNPGMERRVQLFVTIGGPPAPAQSRRPHSIRHVQHESKIRHQSQQPDQRADKIPVRALPEALVGQGGIIEPVAHHPHAGGQRRADALLHVLHPSREVQQRFRSAGPVDRPAQQHAPQQLRPGGAAGLPRAQHREAAGAQGVGQQRGLGGFPSALPALQGDEQGPNCRR